MSTSDDGRPTSEHPEPTVEQTSEHPEASSHDEDDAQPLTRREAKGETGPPRRRRQPASGPLALLRETVIVVVIALGLSLLIKTFLLQAFYIPSESMEDTLLIGDRVIVSKLTPGPLDLKRGQIVVFVDPNNWLDETPEAGNPGPVRRLLTFVGLLPNDSGNHLIKRVIGLPGDHVTCCDKQGRVEVNGHSLDEPYLRPGSQPSEQPFDVTVPAGQLWVMGDNRQQSADSRAHGFVPEKLVTGHAVAVVWPFDRVTWLSRPADTFKQVDSGK